MATRTMSFKGSPGRVPGRHGNKTGTVGVSRLDPYNRSRTPMDRTQDLQLIRRLQARDESAVRELADRYGARIFQLAMRHMKNREDAEEVTQDVLVKVCRKI